MVAWSGGTLTKAGAVLLRAAIRKRSEKKGKVGVVLADSELDMEWAFQEERDKMRRWNPCDLGRPHVHCQLDERQVDDQRTEVQK